MHAEPILPDKESDLALNVGNERDVPKLVSSSDKVDLSKELMGKHINVPFYDSKVQCITGNKMTGYLNYQPSSSQSTRPVRTTESTHFALNFGRVPRRLVVFGTQHR